MNHPTDHLPDYLSGDLEPQEQLELERHLESCAECRAELASLERTVVALTEGLAPNPAPAGSWREIERRLESRGRRSRNWAPFALAAGLVLAALGGIWGYTQQRVTNQLRVEQNRVAGWLSRPDVRAVPIDTGSERVGGVLFLEDGRAMFVLRRPPPRGRAYQAWGRRGEEVVPLEVTQTRTLVVHYQEFERIGVSLEPPGGSPNPTEPLGTVPTE